MKNIEDIERLKNWRIDKLNIEKNLVYSIITQLEIQQIDDLNFHFFSLFFKFFIVCKTISSVHFFHLC